MDFKILDFIQAYLRCSFLDTVMPFFTRLGNIGLIWIFAAAVLLIIPRYRKSGIMLSFALILGLLICNIILKPCVGRIRPFALNDAVKLLIPAPTDPSFPSGHSLASFAAATVFWKRFSKKISIPVLTTAVLIAFSRLYLYVHFPSDVAAGIIIGILCGEISVRLINYLDKKKHLPKTN